MDALLKLWTSYLASGVEGIAGFLIAFAALQATVRALILFAKGTQASDPSQEPQTEAIRLRLGRWLALALEFELGADIRALPLHRHGQKSDSWQPSPPSERCSTTSCNRRLIVLPVVSRTWRRPILHLRENMKH